MSNRYPIRKKRLSDITTQSFRVYTELKCIQQDGPEVSLQPPSLQKSASEVCRAVSGQMKFKFSSLAMTTVWRKKVTIFAEKNNL